MGKASTISNRRFSNEVFELIEVFNRNGMGLNRPILKHIAHQRGIPHQTVHLWVCCREGIVLQQRVSTKKTFPLFWDVSVAGHIHYKETVQEALIRETQEELGIKVDLNATQFLGTFKECHVHPQSHIIDYEFHQCYLYRTEESIASMNPQEEEVAAIKAISKEDFASQIPDLVPHSKRYYQRILKALG